MLDPNFVRNHPEKVKNNLLARNFNPEIANVDKWLQLDEERKLAIGKLEEVNRKKNELADMGKNGVDVSEIRELGKKLKEEQKEFQEVFDDVDKRWEDQLSLIPNIHFDDVPLGKGEDDNVEVRKYLEPTKFNFEPKDHLTIAKDLDLVDFEAGAKVAGSQFYYLKNEAVLLEFGLVQFALDLIRKRGYTPVITPDMAKSRYYLGTGYAPRGDEAQTYEINGEDLGLIATAEVTMAGLHADEVIEKEDLSKRYVAVSHCFRKEAGAYGRYSKGLYRVHQFTKVEMFVYCEPEKSEDFHKEILEIEEEIVKALEIPYRVVEMCTGDLGGMAARKYDIEAWMPGRNDYGEVTSCSNCTDYQARSLNIKYKPKEGKPDYLHMLNGTAIVSSRFPIIILENYQQEDGSVLIPEALQKYVGMDKIEKK